MREDQEPAPLCFIDTETTGVHPGRQVYEIAMIRPDYPEGRQEISFFTDVDLSQADPFGLNVGKFYERHPLGRMLSGRRPALEPDVIIRAPEAAASTVAEWTHGCHLVGLVPDFDANTLDPLLREYGLLPRWHYHLIDVETLAVGWVRNAARFLKGDDRDAALRLATPPWSSDELSDWFGVYLPADEERHTALGDARWAARWYDEIMNLTFDPGEQIVERDESGGVRLMSGSDR